MAALQIIELFAGKNEQNQDFVERLQVKIDDKDQCQLVKSPAFIKGLASGDIIKLNSDTREFEIVRHSGNLCIRVFSKDLSGFEDALIAELESLGAETDHQTPRMLVFSIHVSCGFDKIEGILNKHIKSPSVWLYGNVYDPQDGSTPLNWWLPILNEN